jgi:hypothetical protein
MPDKKEEAIISKMSVKSLGCKPTGGDPKDPSKPNILCIIAGKASGIKMGEDANGKVWSALTGNFWGQNLATGGTFRSGKLFLPSGIHETLEAAVQGLPEAGGVIKFAMKFQSVEAKNPIGYSYQAVNLMPIEADTDELADVIALAGANQMPLLEAAKGRK